MGKRKSKRSKVQNSSDNEGHGVLNGLKFVDNDIDMESTEKVEIPEKDAEEIALEKAVFGDLEGFEESLKQLDIESGPYVEDFANDNEKNIEEEADLANIQDADLLFYMDDGTNNAIDKKSGTDEEEPDLESEADSDSSAAWSDSDDEKLTISIVASNKLKKLRHTETDTSVSGKEYMRRLRALHVRMFPKTKWATDDEKQLKLDNSDEEDSDNEMDIDEEDEQALVSKNEDKTKLEQLLQTSSKYSGITTTKLLPPSTLDIARLKDPSRLGKEQYAPASIQMINFHPTHPLLITGGYDKTLRIYNIDGTHNKEITSLYVNRSPFQTVQFHPDGRRVFGAGRRRYMWIWNIETQAVEKITRMGGYEQTQKSFEKFKLSPCGKYIGLIGSGGWLNVLSALNGQLVIRAKVEGSIADFTWHYNGTTASIINTAGHVWEYSLEEKRFVDRWTDNTGIGITKIAFGGKGDRWCAVGSKSGIVNIYDRTKKETLRKKNSVNSVYKQVATLDQLVTSISNLLFSPDGQMLVFASSAKKDALRVAHIPSFTVFRNWPTSGTPLGRVTAMSFSSGGEMLSIGNQSGKLRLFRLNHFI